MQLPEDNKLSLNPNNTYPSELTPTIEHLMDIAKPDATFVALVSAPVIEAHKGIHICILPLVLNC